MAHQIDESKPKYLSQTRFMSGRRIIKTSVTEITDENVVDVLRKALATHELNRSEIDYLWKYYRGDQPIRNRVKDVRPEICNKITENRANEIVSFKVGYLCGEPIQYVSRNGGEEIVKQINTLNEYMFAEDKAAQDQELVEWQMICGTAFRLVLPDEPGEEDEAPFELYTLDPRDTFVVYSNEIGNKPLMAVKYSKDDNEIFHYSIYTENRYYLVDGDILVESKPHALDMIPIIEYPGNNARLGSFEIVLPLLDAIEVSFTPEEYEIQLAQNKFQYYDEQEMTDPMLVPVGTRHMGTDMFNTVNGDVYGEFKKATMVVPTAKIDFAAFVDAVANLNIESTDNQPEKVAPQTFAFVHPGDTAELRKNLAEDLKYVEAFARAGYIGTVGGVNIYTKKDATKGTIVVATRQAVTIFNKKGVEVETDRNGDIRQNTIWSRKYYLAALTDATKAVKIFKGTATATADTTVSEGKVYYAKTDNGYIVGKPKTNPKTEGFYEIA